MMTTVNWSPGMSLKQTEKMIIIAAVGFFKNNKSQAAKSLGITVKTLYNKLNEYGDDVQLEEKAQEERDAKRTEQLKRERGFVVDQDGRYHTHQGASGETLASHAARRATAKKAQESERQTSTTDDRSSAEGGDGVQSAVEVSAQPTLPLPVGNQVQELSSKQTAASGSARAGGHVQGGNGKTKP